LRELGWFSVKWRGAFSVSEYNAIFGEPVWDDISPTQWRVAERVATETGFKKGKHVGWSALTQPAWVEEQTG
jgi:hypothetical protein